MNTKLSIEAIRFKQIREEMRYTQQQFAKLLHIPSTTADIERGKTKISGQVVLGLMKHFQINPLWLYGETKEKYLETVKPSILPRVISLNSQVNENIIMVNEKAAAGYPHNLQDPQWYERLPAFDLPLPQFRNATYRGFQVEGDSMLPSIKPGDWVIGKAISSFEEIINERVYVIVLQGSILVKKIQYHPKKRKVKLISFNEDYLPVEINYSDVQELWLVNSKLTFGVDEPEESSLLKELRESMSELKSQLKKIN